jgi:hypothetical protein
MIKYSSNLRDFLRLIEILYTHDPCFLSEDASSKGIPDRNKSMAIVKRGDSKEMYWTGV